MSKKEATLVSIIVPVFNLEHEISKCLFSILFQKYQNYEVIVIDDGSTDNSLSICKNFSKKDSRIKVFHQNNLGLSAARNTGIKKTSGDLIAFIDGDDNVDPTFISRLVEALKKSRADIAVCGYSEFHGNKFKSFAPKSKVTSGKEALFSLLTRQENLDILAWNKIYKKSLFDNISFPAGKNHEDNLTTYKLYANAKKVAYLNEPLYNYIRHKNSITKKEKVLDLLNSKLDAVREQKTFFEEDDEILKKVKFAELLAWFQFVDYALIGKISKKYYETYRKNILNEKFEFIDFKRRGYRILLRLGDGFLYKFYRKIIH